MYADFFSYCVQQLPSPVNQSEEPEECFNTCSFDGLSQLGALGYETDFLWYDVVALSIMTVVFLSLAYIILRLVIKQK